jgi:stearoyl-CoA desaturase (delta-9 desaturase)
MASSMTTVAPLACADPFEASAGVPATVKTSQKGITLAIVIGPALALGVFIPLFWGRAVSVTDLVMGAVLYLLTGFGVTVGYHRLFTHGSFKPKRWLKIVLALVGSMAVEGSVTSWVATHRRHHMYSDRAGDPHSPHRFGDTGFGQLKGLFFAHVGWLFVSDSSSAKKYAPDLLRDRDLQVVDRLFPLWAIASLAIPFGLGYAFVGTLAGALLALLWAGLVRMALLHHVTWGINSLCHMFGSRTSATTDRSTNIWLLALVSLGESWHNLHHAHPAWARHGAERGMVDPSARLIRVFESFGWATSVRWPQLARAAAG